MSDHSVYFRSFSYRIGTSGFNHLRAVEHKKYDRGFNADDICMYIYTYIVYPVARIFSYMFRSKSYGIVVYGRSGTRF